MFSLPLLQDRLRFRRSSKGAEIYDPLRKKWVAATPEEGVRQNLIAYCAENMHYPHRRMAAEKALSLAGGTRFDLVVYDNHLNPWLLAECKAPAVSLTTATLEQLLRYHRVLQCRYWLLYNGLETVCIDARDPQHLVELSCLPAYEPVIGGRIAE